MRLSEGLARALCGVPNSRLSRPGELRFGRNGSLSIDLARGLWRDHEAGTGGGVLDLVCRVRGGSRADAARWLEGQGAEAARSRSEPSQPAATASGAHCPPERRDDRRGRELAFALWRGAQPPAGGPVERYLAGRGLCLPDRPSRVLRFHRACPFGADRLPAMLALIRNAITGAPQGVHRTPLTWAGERARDADDAKRPKMILGAARSGAVMLAPRVPDAPALAICEGIETGLAIFRHVPSATIWAALSAGGIAAFPVLAGVERLTIYADNDAKPDGGNTGLAAARQAARRWAGAGRSWAIEYPAAPGLDFADLAVGGVVQSLALSPVGTVPQPNFCACGLSFQGELNSQGVEP